MRHFVKLTGFLFSVCAIGSAFAREPELVTFSPARWNERDSSQNPVLMGMYALAGSELRSSSRPTSVETAGYIESDLRFESRIDLIVPGVVKIRSVNQISCDGTAYVPTWWLPASVELRRASVYPTMAQVACEFGIPTNLMDAVIAQESGYKAWALSGAGAMGMMQVMPATARNLELSNPWDALANMRAGARYLRQQLDRFGRVDLALAAYNAGPERRSLSLGNIPAIPETRNYVQAITTNWVRLTKLGGSNSTAAARAMAANIAVRTSGYREVSLITYEGMNAANPI